MLLGIPSGVTEVEKRAVRDAALNAGARWAAPHRGADGRRDRRRPARQRAVRQPHRRHRRRHDRGRGHQPRRHRRQSRSIRIGGDEMDQDIVNFARREYNLFLGERTAEDIKIAIGSAYPGEWDAQRVTLRGRDLLTGLPRSVEVGADQIREAIEPSVAADRRHDQGHDRGDAAGAGRRHHGPGHRPRRRRRAARRPRPARRRGDPDAGPRRRRPADLRRPRHRRRPPGSRPRWTRVLVAETYSPAACAERARRTAGRAIDDDHAPRQPAPPAAAASRSSVLLVGHGAAHGVLVEPGRPRPPERGRLRLPADPGRARRRRRAASPRSRRRSPRSTGCGPTTRRSAPRTSGCRPRTPGSSRAPPRERPADRPAPAPGRPQLHRRRPRR